MNAKRVLVVGGTGPTGIPIVRGLVERGHRVAIAHRGTHESADTPSIVEHVHCDPFDENSFRDGIASAGEFDLAVVMYGRLRMIASQLSGKVEQFISVGGVPAYRGWMNPFLHMPYGLPVPTSEDAPTSATPDEDDKGYRIVRTEQAVFLHHPNAAHFRYPYVYGPLQLAPREWSVVRRILDGRRRIIVADDGLTLHHHGYTENLAHALLLAVDQPEAGAGTLFNCGDEEVLTIRQVIEIVATALDHDLEIVSMPYSLAVPARPMLTQPATTHRVLDLSCLRSKLGYRDLVPARLAVARTARWLCDHPCERGGTEEMVLTDPFDYANEDRLIDAWQERLQSMPNIAFEPAPAFGLAYSGPGGRPRSNQQFEETS